MIATTLFLMSILSIIANLLRAISAGLRDDREGQETAMFDMLIFGVVLAVGALIAFFNNK